ncbi:phosphatase PAP2 family protein [Helcococcus ovis]|uniref:phosphatase PAP2 family protein n=1 Tax=Helcococcus ovis TaxID=72026 RepID=UPI0010703B16|nr:phosphatase PAP2 family protein [Helcococcus ovis]TFF68481.1 phosphatase PAP2 family protein [Helcococcus ovis]WNZ01460.1 phosphatase PAP2 family protein [Helcococcus ovis]
MKKTTKILLSFLLLGLFGILIGSFYDLQINKLLYARGNLYPETLKFLGEFPMIIIMTTSSLIYLNYSRFKVNKLAYILMLLFFICFPIVSAYGIPRYFNNKQILLSIFIYIFYVSSSIVLFKLIKIEDKEKLVKFAIFTAISIFTIFIIFDFMKNIWGRHRFFDMYQKGDFSTFTNWWILNGKPSSDLFKSFPSGHTSAAASSLILIYIPKVFDVNRKYKKFFIIFPIAWSILVGVSRIFDGAHFLTDISMGYIIASSVIYIIYKKLFDKYCCQIV